MKSHNTSEENRNHFYPNCGCENEADCVPCLHCGMCVANAEYCACCSLPIGADEGLRYDPHREILGG